MDEDRPRREIRIPVPDMAAIKASAAEAATKASKRAKEINSHPPKWLYWVTGIVVLLIIQLIRIAARH